MRLAVALLFLFVYCQGFTQSFVNTQNEWSISIIPNPINPEFKTTIYFFADTLSILDGVEFRRLLQKDDLGNITTNRNYYREENNIVYSRNINSPEEDIIYDFNMSEGDSISYYGSRFLIVSDVTNITTPSGTMRQQYTLYDSELVGNPNHETLVVEGIGAVNSIDSESPLHWPPLATDVSSILNCFTQNEKVEYGCGLNSIEDDFSGQIILRPNPVVSTFYLETDRSANKVDLLEIYQLNGRLMKHYDVSLGHYDISDLNSGVYLLKVRMGRYNQLHKLVKL